MATITLNNSSLKKYLDLLRNLDLKSKKKLIDGLSRSVETDENNKAGSEINALFGAWEDERDSDTIIRDIKEARVDNHDIESFG